MSPSAAENRIIVKISAVCGSIGRCIAAVLCLEVNYAGNRWPATPPPGRWGRPVAHDDRAAPGGRAGPGRRPGRGGARIRPCSAMGCRDRTMPRSRVELEAAVHDRGAMPATVAAIDGKVNVGLCRRAARPAARGAGGREVHARATCRWCWRSGGSARPRSPRRCSSPRGSESASWRPAASAACIAAASSSMDVSADLEELARQPVTVVCSGVKSILDQRRTLERLETPRRAGGRLSAATSCRAFIPLIAASPCRPLRTSPTLCRLIETASRARSARRRGRGAAPAGRRRRWRSRRSTSWSTRPRQRPRLPAWQGRRRPPSCWRRWPRQSDGATVRVNRALARANAGLAGAVAAAMATRDPSQRA